MDKKRWHQVNAILDRALDFDDAGELSAFLHTACGDDEGLRNEVHALLNSIKASEKLWEELLVSSEVLMADMTGGYPPAEGPESVQLGRHHEDVSTEMDIPEQVGPYTIKKQLGRGGMGDVFLAGRTDQDFLQHVALKLIRKEVSSGGQARRFLQERTILSSLNHPNIARLLDGGVTGDGRPWFAMEYVDGRPVTDYCRQHHSTLEERLTLFSQVCKAVQYAHSNFIVHRDLKPDNLLVSSEGQLKVLDFGIAKMLDHDLDEKTLLRTQPGLRMMSLNYAAPEQLTLGPITAATDVYVLGLLLFELLTGTRAFSLQGKKLQEAEWIIRNKEPSKPSTFPTRWKNRLRGDLDVIVLKALRKEPEHRYESVSQLLEDIRRYQKTRPVLARKGTFRYRSIKFVKRNKAVLSAASISLVAVAGFGIWHLYQMAEQRDIAQQETKKAEQVSTFLTDLFQASDPGEARGETVTARELLGKGTERIEELSGQPEVQAVMMNVMGRAYLSLGLYDEAAPLLEGALEMRRSLFGSYHSETAESMHALGKLMYERGELERSDTFLNQALSIRRDMLGADHPEVADVLMDITGLLWKQRRYDDVEPLAYEVLEIRRKAFSANDPKVAEALKGVALLHHTNGNLEEAETLYRESLQIYREHYGEVHPEVARTLHNLGFIAMGRAQWDDAEPYLREALEMKLKLQDGVYTESTVQTLAALGRVHERRGELEEAEVTYRKGIDIIRDMGHRPTLAGGLHVLGTLLMNQDRMQEAAPMFEESLEIRRQVYGPDQRLTLVTQIFLGRARAALGEHDSARQLLQNALPQAQTTFGEDHELVAEAKQALAELD